VVVRPTRISRARADAKILNFQGAGAGAPEVVLVEQPMTMGATRLRATAQRCLPSDCRAHRRLHVHCNCANPQA
jgi:hypothetical protein